MRKFSSGVWQPGRAQLLQSLALTFLESGCTASLAYCRSAENPADAVCRAAGLDYVLPADHQALSKALSLSATAHLSPASIFRDRA